jgi:hypothetical protein
VQLLRTLEQLDALDALVTRAEISPLAIARLAKKQRRNASLSSPTPPPASTEW